MFAQVITGTVTDAEGLKRQVDRWNVELRPGAVGFLGSTGGVTADGKFITVARFESPEAAQANSDRPEQGDWWAETEKCLSDVGFEESTDVTIQTSGDPDTAGFVQVMRGRVLDEAAYLRMMAKMPEFQQSMADFRPDVLAGVTVRVSAERYVDVIYFTSEAEARANEDREMPEAMAAEFAEMASAAEVDEYLDITDPWIN